jgi:hypothetical protein
MGWIAIPLTIQPPELISHRKIPVLYYPFRKGELCCRGELTTMKIANTTTSSINRILASNSARIPHDFFPRQAYVTFHEGDNKLGEGKHQWHGSPRPPVSERSHRRRWRWPQSNNTGLNRSFPIAQSMKINAHPRHGPGGFGVQRTGKPTHELYQKKGTHISWPASIISLMTRRKTWKGSERRGGLVDETIY